MNGEAEVRVCNVDVAPVRAEPDDASEQVTQALRGEPLTVEETRDGWARIRTAYDYPGWIRTDALSHVPSPGLGAWLIRRCRCTRPVRDAARRQSRLSVQHLSRVQDCGHVRISQRRTAQPWP